MPETPYLIDKKSELALLRLNKGQMASFYLFADSAASKAGLTAARATSASSITASETGKIARKEMGVAQFARGVLFAKGPGQLVFVHYGGNLSKARMEFVVGIMRKRGRFDPRIIKALRDAEIFDKQEFTAKDASGVSMQDTLLAAEDVGSVPDVSSTDEPSTDEPSTDEVTTDVPPPDDSSEPLSSTTPPTLAETASSLDLSGVSDIPVDPSMSKAELLTLMELSSLEPDDIEAELKEVLLEALGPLTMVLDVDVSEIKHISELEKAVREALDELTPEVYFAMTSTEHGRAIAEVVGESVASAVPLDVVQSSPDLAVLGRVRELIEDPLRELVIKPPDSKSDLAIWPTPVHFNEKRWAAYCARIVRAGKTSPDGEPVVHIKRTFVLRVEAARDALVAAFDEVLDDAELTDEERALDLQAEQELGVEAIEEVLDALDAPGAVIDEIALGDLREVLGELEMLIREQKAGIELAHMQSLTNLTDLRFVKVEFLGVMKMLKVSDSDLASAVQRQADGTLKPVVCVAPTTLEARFSGPAVAASVAVRDGSGDFGEEIKRAERVISDGLEELTTWKHGLLVVTPAQLAIIRESILTFNQALATYQASIGDALPEYAADRQALADMLHGSDTLDDLNTLRDRAVRSVQESFSASNVTLNLSIRLTMAPYACLVWHKGSSHEAHWTEPRRAAAFSDRGYGPELSGRVLYNISAQVYYLQIEGGAAYFEVLKPLFSQAGLHDVVLITDDEKFNACLDVINGVFGSTKRQATRMLGLGASKVSEKEWISIRAALDRLKEAGGVRAIEVGAERIPKTPADEKAFYARYAERSGVPKAEQGRRPMKLEAILADSGLRDVLLQFCRQELSIETILFYVGFVEDMAPYRRELPELLPMMGLSGVDRVRWLYETFVDLEADQVVNLMGATQTELRLRYEAHTQSASAGKEFAACTADVRLLANDILARFMKLGQPPPGLTSASGVATASGT